MYVCRYACVCWCRRGGIYILKSLAPGISPSHPKTKKESVISLTRWTYCCFVDCKPLSTANILQHDTL